MSTRNEYLSRLLIAKTSDLRSLCNLQMIDVRIKVCIYLKICKYIFFGGTINALYKWLGTALEILVIKV